MFLEKSMYMLLKPVKHNDFNEGIRYPMQLASQSHIFKDT